MPKRKPGETSKSVEALTHQEATRKHIPTAEHEAVMEQDDRDPIPVAYRRRNRDLDPQLVWRGEDKRDASGLVVQSLPLFIQEKLTRKYWLTICGTGASRPGWMKSPVVVAPSLDGIAP